MACTFCCYVQEWERGLTVGAPVWPELLDRLVRVKDQAVRQRAKQAVLDNREVLLGVLGPELAAEIAELRLVKEERYEDADDFFGDNETRFYEEEQVELEQEADGSVVIGNIHDLPPRLQTAATAMRKRLWRVVTTLAPAAVDINSLGCECTDSQGSLD